MAGLERSTDSFFDDPARQLELLNAEWKRITRDVVFYRALVESGEAPSSFDSVESFASSVPILEKKAFRSRSADLVSPGRTDFMRITGGSTGEPTQMPAWSSELRVAKRTSHIGRRWQSVNPGDRLFLFWGHAHLLGSGWRGAIKKWTRRFKDRVLGYKRFSCYDLSPGNLRRAMRELARFRPDYVCGYAAALDLLAREILALREQGVAEASAIGGIKTVIATAESLPFDDSRAMIEAAFGAPVSFEYGSVEAGVIAYSHPDGGYRAFWQDYLVEALEPENEISEIVITSLYPRKTPLVRYRIGDQIRLGKDALLRGPSVFRFESVLGRANLPVRLPSGRLLHSETASHLARAHRGVSAYQFVVLPDAVVLRVVAPSLPSEDRAQIFEKASRMDAELAACLRLECVASVTDLERSVAGKIPLVVTR